MAGFVCLAAAFVYLRAGLRLTTLIVGAFLLVEAFQISTWLPHPTFTLKEADHSLADITGQNATVVTRYETLFLSSGTKVICYWPREGFNVDAFEKFNPDYIMILRRDNWIDSRLDEMSPEEWPAFVRSRPTRVGSFDLCPTPAYGPRFIAELYRLGVDKREQSALADAQNR